MADHIEALREAERALHGAWAMLDAICSDDYSRDRAKARDRAWDALCKLRDHINTDGVRVAPVAWVPIHPRTGPLWSMTTDKPNPERLPGSYPLRPLVFADGVPGRVEGSPDAG